MRALFPSKTLFSPGRCFLYGYYGIFFVEVRHDERIVYVSVLNNISVDCDCDGNPAEPDIHDIGILASTDPVAIDLCLAAQGSKALQNRIQRQQGLHTLEHAEEIGLGSREYKLINID